MKCLTNQLCIRKLTMRHSETSTYLRSGSGTLLPVSSAENPDTSVCGWPISPRFLVLTAGSIPRPATCCHSSSPCRSPPAARCIHSVCSIQCPPTLATPGHLYSGRFCDPSSLLYHWSTICQRHHARPLLCQWNVF